MREMKKPLSSNGFQSSRGGTRTPDPVINSHLLYQLSYSGKCCSLVAYALPAKCPCLLLLACAATRVGISQQVAGWSTVYPDSCRWMRLRMRCNSVAM